MDQPQKTYFPLVRAMLSVAVVAGVCAAVSWQGLPWVGAESLAMPATIAFAICGAIGLVALLPVALLDRLMPAGAAYGFMIGMLLRLIGCSVAYIALDRAGYPNSFAYAMAVAYIVLLGVELAVIGPYIRNIQLPAGRPVSGSNAAAEVGRC